MKNLETKRNYQANKVLSINNQKLKFRDELRLKVADCILFGALPSCPNPNCNKASLTIG